MKEIWKDYKVYNGSTLKSYVEISDLGNIKGYLWNYEVWSDEFITFIGGRKAIKNHHFLVYTLVDRLFRGPLPKGYCVHHVNHDKLDDRLENLQRITIREHCAIHNKYERKNNGKWTRTPEFKQQQSEKRKGIHIPEERKQAISTTMKKKIWFTNGIQSIRLFEGDDTPEGFYQGRLIKHRRTKKEMNNDKV